MIRELQGLSLSVTTANDDQVGRVITAVCRKIDELLHTKLVRVYKKERARTSTLLKPFAIISDNEVDVETISIEKKPQGVISWCVHNEAPVWLEGLTTRDDSSSLQNRADSSFIAPEYLDFTFRPDSILVLPMKSEGDLVGVFVVELDRSDVITEAMFQEFSRVCISLGRLLDKSNTHSNHLKDTTRAVEQFLNSLLGFQFPETLRTGNVRTGFIARPFETEFDQIGKIITDSFSKNKICAIHYQPESNMGLVVLGIIEQIRNAHFYVVDLTGLNRNVLLEFGLILSDSRNQSKCLLLRDKEDQTELPFDVVGYPIHRYKHNISDSTLQVWTAGGDLPESFNDVIQRFITNLEGDIEFRNAKAYEE